MKGILKTRDQKLRNNQPKSWFRVPVPSLFGKIHCVFGKMAMNHNVSAAIFSRRHFFKWRRKRLLEPSVPFSGLNFFLFFWSKFAKLFFAEIKLDMCLFEKLCSVLVGKTQNKIKSLGIKYSTTCECDKIVLESE